MPDPILQTIGLTRTYQMGRETLTALAGVNISLLPGEFVAIVGPSGCGKSTLLNLLGGLDRPTGGHVFIQGPNLAHEGEEQLALLRRDKLGFIFQQQALLPVLTARENVEFPLLLAGVQPVERRVRADEFLTRVGLADKGSHLPDELSGGEQQRVGIAGALVKHPLLLLADEPTGNLDSATAMEVMELLVGLVHKLNLTLVLVTHDPAVAARADRILRLKDGRLLIAMDPAS